MKKTYVIHTSCKYYAIFHIFRMKLNTESYNLYYKVKIRCLLWLFIPLVLRRIYEYSALQPLVL
jgi:hypothetical protein